MDQTHPHLPVKSPSRWRLFVTVCAAFALLLTALLLGNRTLRIKWHEARGSALWREGRKAEARFHFDAASSLGSDHLSVEQLESYAEEIGETMPGATRIELGSNGSQ